MKYSEIEDSLLQSAGIKRSVEEPVFASIKVWEYIMPILHITIGKGNEILTNFIYEMQAAAEAYSEQYQVTEKQLDRSRQELQQCKEEMSSYMLFHKPYIKELKSLKHKLSTLSNKEQVQVIDNLEEMDNHVNDLQAANDKCHWSNDQENSPY